MQRKIYRSGVTLLLGSFFLFGIGGCSPALNFSSWSPFWGQGEGYFAARKAKQDIQAFYRLACAYQEKNQHQIALEEFKRILRLDPNHVQSYNGMGISYDRLGNPSRALGCYAAALKINPDLDYVHNNMGYSYLLQGDAARAAEAFEKAIALNSTNDRYRNNLGVAYAQMGKVPQALAQFESTERQETTPAPAVAETSVAPAVETVAEAAPSVVAATAVVAAIVEPAAQSVEKNTSDPFRPIVKTILPQGEKRKAGVSVPAREENMIVRVPAVEAKKQAVAKTQSEPVREKSLVAGVPAVNTEARPLAKSGSEQPRAMTAMSAHVVSAPSVEPVRAIVAGSRKAAPALPAMAQQMFAAHKPLGPPTVEVANGSGGKGVAAWWGGQLWQQGVTVAGFTNAPAYAKTRIYYTEGYLQEAYRVAKIIPLYQEFERVAAFENSDVKIRVVIGRDVLRFTGKETEKKIIMAMADI